MAGNPGRALWLLGLLTVAFFTLHVGLGSYELIPPGTLLRELWAGPGRSADPLGVTVWEIRLPRAALCLLSGALLGIVGSAFQALLRNPLADPYVVGVSSGSAVGGSLAVVLGIGEALGGLGIALAAFSTGLGSLAIVYFVSRRRGVTDVRTLLLAGVVLGALFSSLLAMVLLAGGRDTNDVLHWLLGDTSVASWPKDALLALVLVPGFVILAVESKRLNAFALGEDAAGRLGVDAQRLTRIVLVTGGALTAAAVGAVGIIGFLGLAAPHIARRLAGVDWRWSLPGSLLCGAMLLLASDVIAGRALSLMTRTVGMEVPVGIVTSILGAPFLLVLLRRQTIPTG